MTRDEAEKVIDTLYSHPADRNEPEGQELLLELLKTMGLSAFTDEAVVALAELHRSRFTEEMRRPIEPRVK